MKCNWASIAVPIADPESLATGERKNPSPLPARLTQARRIAARAGNLVASTPRIPQTKARCPLCGSTVTTGSVYCAKCVPDVNRQNLLRQAKLGQIATHSIMAEALRAATQRKQAAATREWDPSTLPKWLDEDYYRREILPRLFELTVKKIRLATDVSYPCATLIKRGGKIPHPRHWLALARVAGVAHTLQVQAQQRG